MGRGWEDRSVKRLLLANNKVNGNIKNMIMSSLDQNCTFCDPKSFLNMLWSQNFNISDHPELFFPNFWFGFRRGKITVSRRTTTTSQL